MEMLFNVRKVEPSCSSSEQSYPRDEDRAEEEQEPHFVTLGGAINQSRSEKNKVTQKTSDH
jgi:hypothetical protein